MSIDASTWVLTDGAAGNRRQALALAAALGAPAPREFVLEARRPWRWLAPRRFPGDARAFGDRFAAALATPPALAIGCGRQAALATRLLRERGATAIQLLDPRIDPRHWDLVIAPHHDRLRGANVLEPVGSLHPIDDHWVAQARHDFAALGDLPGPRTVLLLGGPVRNAPMDSAWWRNTSAAIEHWLERDGGSLLVSGSRRTPDWLREAARKLCPNIPGLRWFDESDGANPYAGLLAFADRIVVSHDSVNLLSEACATNVPVHVAADHHLRGRHRRFVQQLIDAGRARWLRLDARDWPVTPLRETARIAQEVRLRLGR